MTQQVDPVCQTEVGDGVAETLCIRAVTDDPQFDVGPLG